jgi:hypothetical protein
MYYMTSLALQRNELSDAPKLRLFAAEDSVLGPRPSGQSSAERHALRLVNGPPAPAEHPVLVAGGDSAGRAAVMRDLSESMPSNTTFAEAGAFWEVLVQAPDTSMVVLSGELDEVPAESLMQMLAKRHPGLPVVSLAAPTSSPEPVAGA